MSTYLMASSLDILRRYIAGQIERMIFPSGDMDLTKKLTEVLTLSYSIEN